MSLPLASALRPSRTYRAVFQYISLLVPLILLVGSGPASATILRWNVEATVVEISDPDGIFPDIRIGDPVRGNMSYDVAVPGEIDGEHDALYFHDPGAITLVEMTVENPRTLVEITFEPNADFFTAASVTNDGPDEDLGTFDSLNVAQEIVAPDDFLGFAPIISVSMIGQDAIPDLSLPTELDLAEWNQAIIFIGDLFDLFEEEPVSSYLFAEIHTLEPAPHPGVLGDFNRDGVVDAADYTRWRDELDFYYSEPHYDQWKQNFGLSAQVGGAGEGAPVPEPTTLALLFIGTFTMSRVRRIQFL